MTEHVLTRVIDIASLEQLGYLALFAIASGHDGAFLDPVSTLKQLNASRPTGSWAQQIRAMCETAVKDGYSLIYARSAMPGVKLEKVSDPWAGVQIGQLPEDQIEEAARNNQQLEGVVPLDLSTLAWGDNDEQVEQFLTLLSRSLIGSDYLTDIHYQVVGVLAGRLLTRVTGHVMPEHLIQPGN